MTVGGMDVGSWAELIAAMSAMVGTLLSIFALKRAGAANATAEKTREEAREAAQAAESREALRDRTAEEQRRRIEEKEAARDLREAERERREHEREQRQLAGSVQAWWAVRDDTDWGVMVSNEIGAGAVFHDIVISSVGNQYARDIRIETLPPGRFFVRSGTAGSPWGLPEPAESSSGWRPIMRSPRHEVHSISFTDPLGERWTWTPARGLSRMPADQGSSEDGTGDPSVAVRV